MSKILKLVIKIHSKFS